MKLNNHEILVVKNAIQNVLKNLEGELEVRTGFYNEEIQKFYKIISPNNDLNLNELLVVNQVLNEVCNGYEIVNFVDTIGADETFVRDLLRKVNILASEELKKNSK